MGQTWGKKLLGKEKLGEKIACIIYMAVIYGIVVDGYQVPSLNEESEYDGFIRFN